jgi:dihydrofolate reductase
MNAPGRRYIVVPGFLCQALLLFCTTQTNKAGIMKKVILNLAVTLDGYIEGPKGEIDWCVFDDNTAKALHDFIGEIDTIFYGRVSYEMYGNYNPPGESSEAEKEFYRLTNSMAKYVFSRSTKVSDGKGIVISDNIKEEVNRIKQQPGKDIWLYGGSSLITTFVNLDLIDEYRLAVHSIVLGGGKSLFKDILGRVPLRLYKTEGFSDKVVGLYYMRG